MQIFLTYYKLHNTQQIIMHETDAGASFWETTLIPDQKTGTKINHFENIRSYRHGASALISSDIFFNNHGFVRALKDPGITFATEQMI